MFKVVMHEKFYENNKTKNYFKQHYFKGSI